MIGPIDKLLPRLRGVKKTHNGWDALCPAHDDHNPSLGIRAANDGKVLLRCRSHNCTPVAICKSIGLTLADLFPPQSPNGAASKAKTIVASYRYTDSTGKLLYEVVRYRPKDFKQRRPNPYVKGRWLWNLQGVERVLYRLPQMLQAVAEGNPIFVVEGEKDADRLAKLGLAATTNAGGAGKWKPEYSTYLHGAHLVLVSDNDEAGRRHVEQIARSAKETAASIKALTLPDVPEKGDVSDWLDAGGTREKLLELVAACPDWKSPQEKASAKSEDTRPTIVITTAEHDVNCQAVDALVRDSSIFQRGAQLVRVMRDVSPAANGIRRPFAPRIETLPQALLRELLTANARWVIERETDEGTKERDAHPPGWCVAAVHNRGVWPSVRHLEAVVDYPILRPDGTILNSPGYDPDTGLFLEVSGTNPVIPPHPTSDDASVALKELHEVISDFPFESDIHRAAWLAALLTPLARFAFSGPSPLFLVDANVRAAGKGLLLDCVSRIVTGERFTIATYTGDGDELRKRITSLALAGDRLVLFDNLAGKFGNAELDAALTATAWQDRLLGANRIVKAPLYMTWYATGNNVSIAGDTARRVCHIRLECPEERPEERADFRRPNLLAWVGENRSRLLGAALIILRAYFEAGCPPQGLPAWGSFEGWSTIVRSAVVWIGLPDPGQTRIVLQNRADVATESMIVVLNCWEKLDPNRVGLTAAEIIDVLKDSPDLLTDYHLELRAALEALLGKPDPRNLGNLLRRYRRRMLDGRFFDQAGSLHRAARWAVYPAEQFRNLAETHGTHKTHLGRGESCESGESAAAGRTIDV